MVASTMFPNGEGEQHLNMKGEQIFLGTTSRMFDKKYKDKICSNQMFFSIIEKLSKHRYLK
jgi:hypothetical protein